MSLANPEFISGEVLSKRWMLDAFELHQIVQDEGLGVFDRHSNPISTADAIPSPVHQFDNFLERYLFEALHFRYSDISAFEKKWGVKNSGSRTGKVYAGNLYYPLRFIDGRRLIKILEIDNHDFLQLIADNVLSVYDSFFIKIDRPIETLEKNRYTRKAFDLSTNESFLLIKLKALFFDSNEAIRFCEKQVKPNLNDGISDFPDFTSVGVNGIVKYLKWVIWQSIKALHNFYRYRHKVEESAGNLDDPGGMVKYIEIFLATLENYCHEIQRLSLELQLFISREHIDSFKQLYSDCIELEKTACRPFTDSHINRSLEDENLRSLGDRLYSQTRDIVHMYRGCLPIAERLEALAGTENQPDTPADKGNDKPKSKRRHSQNTKYDVIIVGAGPSGLECARVLQDSNLSVLILEKGEQIGPKTCAGGIVETIEPLDLPATKARTVNAVNVFVGEKEYEFVPHLSIKVIDREDLGRYQEKLLSNAGNVTIKTGTTVTKIDQGKVATNAGNFGYRYLVGADGSTSVVRRYLKIDSRYMVGMYYDIEERKDRMVFYLNGTSLKTGYLWEFPHQQFTNVGFYYNPVQWKTRDAVRILRHHMKSKGCPIDSRTFRAFPINYLYKGYQFGKNLFLAGDAAGLASKLTGEGIAYAMISGREIARKIMDPPYELSKLKEIVTHKKRQDRLVNVLEKIPMGLNAIYRLHIKALKTRILRWPG